MVLNTTETRENSSLLSLTPLPPAAPLIAASFYENWHAIGASGIEPRVASEGTSSATDIAAFEEGFKLLRLDLGKRGVLPQQVKTVDVLSSGRRFAAVLEPRQSSKTTTIEVWLLGLCATIPGIQIAYAVGTTGKAARDHFLKKIVPPLEALYRDKNTRPMDIRKGSGQERISFHNGSLFQVCATPDDFRGSSFDIIWLDEAGELEGQSAEDMLSAAQPTQDTRGGVILDTPLMIVSGTAGESRAGNTLHDFLERGRAGDPQVAIIEYSAGTDLVIEDVEDWDEDVVPLLLTCHPGINTLTTLDTIKGNFHTMDRERFMREYLGIFGSTGMAVGLFNPSKWLEAEVNSDVPAPPEWFAVGVRVERYGTRASICAAWRDSNGKAHIAVLDHREGVEWLAGEVIKLAEAHKYVPIVYDDQGTNRLEMEKVVRGYPRARLVKLARKDVTVHAPLLVKEVHSNNLVHYGQGALTTGMLAVRKRDIASYGGWAYGRPAEDVDITPVEAASFALLTYDQTPPRKPMNVYFGN